MLSRATGRAAGANLEGNPDVNLHRLLMMVPAETAFELIVIRGEAQRMIYVPAATP